MKLAIVCGLLRIYIIIIIILIYFVSDFIIAKTNIAIYQQQLSKQHKLTTNHKAADGAIKSSIKYVNSYHILSYIKLASL